MRSRLKTFWPFILVFLFSAFLLTFKTLQVPPGIETDEGSIVYNAVLISQTLHDQNHRFIPFFFLSSDHLDWKQPVLVYLSAIFLKVFGANLYVFKMVNVCTSLASLVLLGYLLYLLFKSRTLVLIGMLVYATTPIIIITSRIGNESIQPILYTTLWLLFLVLFRHTNKKIYLALAAFSLGIDFYCFKGMRIIVPVYIFLSFVYIYWHYFIRHSDYRLLSTKKFPFIKNLRLFFSALFKSLLNRRFLSRLFTFILVLLPFFLTIPFLEAHYPGAVFDRHLVHIESYRYYLYYWFQNLNFAFLYTSADIGKIYSVEIFGAFFITALPFFLLGVKKAISKVDFNLFILVSYLLTPIFFGFAESTDYSHRLISIIPFFVIIVVLGVQSFMEYFHRSLRSSGLSSLVAISLLTFISLLTLVHFGSFFSYYYFQYANQNDTHLAFGNDLNSTFYQLSKLSQTDHLTPYVQSDIYDNHGDGNKFYNMAYFHQTINDWKLGESIPDHSVLLTQNNQVDGFVDSKINVAPYFILIKK